MPDPAPFWERQKRSLDRASKRFRKNDPEALSEVLAVLRRISLAAWAAGHSELARRSRRIRRRLSGLRTLEAHRRLLARVHRLGLLSPEAAAGLDVRWEELSRTTGKGALRALRGRSSRRLRRSLSRRSLSGEARLRERLEESRQRISQRLAPPADRGSDRELRRYRRTIGRARDCAEGLAELGLPATSAAARREEGICAALGRWSEARLFRKRLARELRQAERRGAVTLALELERLIEALGGTLSSLRLQALEQARDGANVVSLRDRTA